MDTIFALASGSYRSGVAVVRVSGSQALPALLSLTGLSAPDPRHALLADISHAGRRIDRGLVIAFPAPASFTGDDVVEFHLHGGRAVIDGLLAALGSFPDCRMALPGEFTRRAFENGKLDLTGAEAIADLIDAETEAQREQALSQLDGSLSRIYRDWTDRLAKILAHQEADIEFPDDDMPTGISDVLKNDVGALAAEIRNHLDDKRRGERLRDGLRVAIIGAPNAGKSTLLNALAHRDVAIVSAEAGTTRDVIEAHLNLGGYPVIVADTAGLRDTAHVIEAEGIRRAQARASDADIKIALFDSTAPVDAQTRALVDDKTIVVYTKRDLGGTPRDGYAVSVHTEEGMDEFLSALTATVAAQFTGKGASPTRQRHRSALSEAVVHLESSLAAPLPELAAEDLRIALGAIGSITGRVHVEDLLDRIFRDFCIGK
jgi:tRNA modification GTPase